MQEFPGKKFQKRGGSRLKTGGPAASAGLRREVQSGRPFLRCPFFGRRAPISEAFFTSVIQIVSGIRYEEKTFFLGTELGFFSKFLKKFFIASFSPERQKIEFFYKNHRQIIGFLEAVLVRKCESGRKPEKARQKNSIFPGRLPMGRKRKTRKAQEKIPRETSSATG